MNSHVENQQKNSKERRNVKKVKRELDELKIELRREFANVNARKIS